MRFLDLIAFFIFKKVYIEVIEEHSHICNNYYAIGGKGFLNLLYMDHFLILCYRVAHCLYIEYSDTYLADAIYYSARVRTSTDIFYRAKIGKYFMPTHHLRGEGSCLEELVFQYACLG